MSDKLSVGVAVITHNAKKHLKSCLPPLLQSPLRPRVVVVNSSSNDGTVELAQELGAETLVIPRTEFNHGTTREKARKFLQTDIIVMVTPDAYAQDIDCLNYLTEPLRNGKASISYARQIPHDGANFFEAFSRTFNYPATSHIRGIEETKTYGIYTFFCSNSFAAYKNEALDEIGGFQPVLMGEDTVAVAKLLQRGHKIAYVSEAVVKHSHGYTLKQEFQRHFDTGLARHAYRDLIAVGGTDSKRGRKYAATLFKSLCKEKPSLIPYAAVQTLIKWFGYQMGKRGQNAPLWVKRKLSSQDFYWV